MNTDNARTGAIDMPRVTVPVILIRHAQSEWNRENRFTGWADPALTQTGIREAAEAAERLRRHDYRFDIAYSSRLQLAITTLKILLERLGARPFANAAGLAS